MFRTRGVLPFQLLHKRCHLTQGRRRTIVGANHDSPVQTRKAGGGRLQAGGQTGSAWERQSPDWLLENHREPLSHHGGKTEDRERRKE
jgi:hypothetical protein